MPAAALPSYRGPFAAEHAERLLWRAGFGPRPGDVERTAKLGLDEAVRSLTHPPAEKLAGPSPHDEKGRPLAPADAWGHDHLWWLDRMVRSNRQLVERMTLVWHDWFATSNAGVGSQRLMLRQNALLRRNALGSFSHLLLGVTRDPAMLLWLNGTQNSKEEPNENYARELMELFTLGAGRGYREADVREQARALTGFRNDWRDGVGPTHFRFDSRYHDAGMKRVFGKRGRFDWRAACRLCIENPRHSSFFVRKLWSYFVPVAPDAATQRGLERLYREHGYAVRPMLEAILRHPAFYEGPRMTKPPVVYIAGMLRALDRGIDTQSWTWLADTCGQLLFQPPNVSGWDDECWLDTATFYGRWLVANYATKPYVLATSAPSPRDAEALVDRACAFWGEPTLSRRTRSVLTTFAGRALGDANASWKRSQYPPLIENALRQLIAVSPDFQTS